MRFLNLLLVIFICSLISYCTLEISKQREYFFHHNLIFRAVFSFENKSRVAVKSNTTTSIADVFPNYINLKSFHRNDTDSGTGLPKRYKEGYTITFRANNITEQVIQASIIDSNVFQREETYITQYFDHDEQPIIDYDLNPCKNFSFPYCVLQNFDDSDHIPFAYSLFYQSKYVIYVDVDQLDIPLSYINTTFIDTALMALHNDEIDVFTCTTYLNRLLNGCLIAKQPLIRKLVTTTTMSKGKLDVLDYVPLYFQETHQELRVQSFLIKDGLSPYLNVQDKLIPSVFGCNDLTENDTSFTVTVPTYRRPKLKMVFDPFDRQDFQPTQVLVLQNNDFLHWDSSLVNHRNTTYYHIWCSNWNSKYVGKYFPSIIVDTTFNFVIDDDWFIQDTHAFHRIVHTIRKDHFIHGRKCHQMIFKQFGKPHKTENCDLVTALLYARVKHFKIMFQGELFTYVASEDSQISVINHFSCGIETRKLDIDVTTSTDDEYQRNNFTFERTYVPKPSYHRVTFPSRSFEYDGKRLCRCWGFNLYFEKGYIPVLYRDNYKQ